jgi:anti-sigma-K factor RskA/putative zinc finger protein
MTELLEGYALHALEPDETRAVEDHLAGCRECRQVLAEYEEALAGLPAALGAASPMRLHPALKQRVMRSLDRPGRRRLAGQAWWRAAAVVAALLLAASLAWNWRLSVELAHQRAVQAELVGRITHDQATVFDVVDSPATTKRMLRSPADESMTGPYGKVFSRSDSADVVVMVNRLPQPPENQRYQLYLTSTDGTVTVAGTLPVDGEGFSYLVARSDHAGPRFRHIEVRTGSQVVLTWDGTR